ncbi:Crp/Fnr family transcriptional regulator [Candidatus Microgenomates bacterium]|nr:Crp/Fnr family transcriptional regulator [Candidatus Microgenomates bacterium]
MYPLEVLEEFFAKSGPIRYKKGDTILRADDEPRGVYFLKKGYVRLYSISASGEEITLIIFKPQDFFPVMWAINNTPNMFYVEAMTPVEVYRVSRNEFVDFIKGNSDVLFELTSKILVRLGGLLQRMQYLAFGNAYARVASIIYICAERFGLPRGQAGKKNGNSVVIDVPLAHKDVANLIGMTRETVSVEMKNLARKGLVEYKGKIITVRDLAKLREESLLDEE